MANKKTNHGGARPGSGRKSASALRCPTCVILAEQLRLASEREKSLLKKLDVKDAQIGTVIDSKFETVRISNLPRPEPDKPAMPIDQLMDVEAVDDGQFLKTVSELTN